MDRRKKLGKVEVVIFYIGLAFVIAFVLSGFNSFHFLINLLVAFGIYAAIFGLWVAYQYMKKKVLRRDQKKIAGEDSIFKNLPTEAMFHMERAWDAENRGDYLGARVSFIACVELLKRDNAATEELKIAKGEYADFVREDPIFNAMLPFFLDAVRQNPGILQSEITSKAEQMGWSEIRQYGRSVSKDDIRYVLYFAEEFGLLVRQKKGRSYQLYLAGQEETADHGSKAISHASLRTEFRRGAYERAMKSDMHPYLMYRTGNNKKCIEEHAALDGLVLPKSDPWWDNFLNQNNPDCNCGIVSVTENRLQHYKTEGVPVAPRLDGTGGGTIPVKTVVP